MRGRLLIGVLVGIATAVSAESATSPRKIFAGYDPEGRLPHTTIRLLGKIRVQSSLFSIYYLDFTNPQTRHGQQRIAIIKNGRHFAGAYQCTLGAGEGKLTLGKNKIVVVSFGTRSVIRFTEAGPSRNRYFCSNGSGWENQI